MSEEFTEAPEVTETTAETVEPTVGGGEETITQTPEPTEFDWRAEMVGDNDEYAKALSRYRSPEAVTKALIEAKKALRERTPEVATLTEDSTEEEVKAFREAMGVPEAVDGYEVGFSEGFEVSETDQVMYDSFKQAAHEANFTPAQLQKATEWYENLTAETQQALNENEHNTRVETQAELRSEWGGEYKSNINALNTFIANNMDNDADAARELMETRLENGARLGDHLPFIRMMVGPAIDHVGPNAIFSGDVQKMSMDLDARKNELLQLQLTDPQKYKSDPVQQELAGIYAQKEKLENFSK